MNKAEEQYVYNMGELVAKLGLLTQAHDYRGSDRFPVVIKEYCNNTIAAHEYSKMKDGIKDYLTTIIHAIDGNVITDWPSFVTYMTGETYGS